MRRRREMGSEEPWSRLEGKVVMVTGASSGIGRDLCVDLAKAGCLIVASARRTDLLRSLCEEVRALTVEEPGRIAAVRLDISQDGDTIDAAVQAAWEVFGRIDVLVNNAGDGKLLGERWTGVAGIMSLVVIALFNFRSGDPCGQI